jgi:basic amino acid/polyamine antiporter, APA family
VRRILKQLSSGELFKVKKLSAIIKESENPDKKLKKVLGAFDLIILGIGVIIGAGIFATVGTAAAGDAMRPGAGPALIVSFAITAIVCGFAALCYAELASIVPISGSAYTYSYATFGELIAWIIGWDLMLEYIVGSIAVSISWSGYFQSLLRGFGLNLPAWLSIDSRSAVSGFHKASSMMAGGTNFDKLNSGIQFAYFAVSGAPRVMGVPIIFNMPAVIIVLLLTALLVIGIKESARFNTGIVLVKLLVLGFFIAVGAFFIKPHNWVPFAPNGFAGIKAGAAIAFFAYIGFDAVSTAAEETHDPARNMPIGIIGSLVICTLIYMAVAAVFTGIMPFSTLTGSMAHQKAEPLALAMSYIKMDWAAGIVAVGAVLAQIAVLLVLLMGQARIFFSMARDGLLPPVFSSVHRIFKTPYVTTILTGSIVAFFAAFTNIEEMVDLTNIGTLFAFVLVCLGVIILRAKEPDVKRGFTVPFNPWIPLLGAFACFFLMTGLPTITWYRFVIWLLIGLVIYFSYSYRHSLLRK